MDLLTPELRAALFANTAAHHPAQAAGFDEPDPAPVVKFFNPVGTATWLATELDADGDTLFGLADSRLRRCPELGSFSLADIASVRLPFGLSIERDEGFSSEETLSVWADTARRTGSIIQAETAIPRGAGHRRRIRYRQTLPKSFRPRTAGTFDGRARLARIDRSRPPLQNRRDRHSKGVVTMKLAFVPLGNLSVSKTNMRFAKKRPDVADIFPGVRKRGVLQPVLVRPNCSAGCFEIVAGSRRFTAAEIVAEEQRAVQAEVDDMPCAILNDGDDADPIEASMIEDMARLDADDVPRWETFTRLPPSRRRNITWPYQPLWRIHRICWLMPSRRPCTCARCPGVSRPASSQCI